MFKKLMAIMLLSPLCLQAAELTTNATVIEVVTHGNKNVENFGIRVEGGTGICPNGQWIIFSEDKFPSTVSYAQSFSIALMALKDGNKVRIHNYNDNSCDGANFIAITRK